MKGFEINIREHKKKEKAIIANTLFVLMLLGAMFYAFFSVFHVEIDKIQTIAAVMIAVFPSLILLWNKKNLLKKIGAALLGMILFVVFLYEKMWKGVSIYINSYINLYNEYHNRTVSGISIIIEENDSFFNIAVLFFIACILGFCFLVILEKKKGLPFAVLLLLLPVILSATIGKMPATEACFLLIGASCFYIIAYHCISDKWPLKECGIAAIILGILFCTANLLQPFISEYKAENIDKYHEIKEKITESQREGWKQFENQKSEINRKTENLISGGAFSGRLSKNASFNPTGETVMEIVLDEKPRNTIYLKGFVGAKYTGDGWKEISSFELSKVVSFLGGSNDRRAILNEPFRRINEGNTEFSVKHMEIELKGASKAFGYAPYFAEIANWQNVHLDSYVKGTWSNTREYDMYLESPIVWHYNEYYTDSDSSSLAEASELWKEYRDFVKEAYVGEYEELELFNEYCENIDKEYLDFIEMYISVLYSGEYKYRRNPGEMPENMDLMEGFFFEKKRGFCVHFASSAAIIYQICGVPARYVEGYAVYPEAFEEQADGTYKVTVTDENGHAWCEVFNDEVGWVVKEFTPGSQTLGVNDEINDEPIYDPEDEPYREEDFHTPDDPQKDDLEEEGFQEEQEDDSENMVEISGEQSDGKLQKQSKLDQSFYKVAAVIGFITFIVFVIVLQQKIRKRVKIRAFKRKIDNEGILKIYKEIYNISIFSKKKMVGKLDKNKADKEFIEEMASLFTNLSDEDWNWIYDTAEKAAFSEISFSVQEQKKMYHLYKKVRKKILEGLHWSKRLWFLYGRAM